MNRNMGFEKNQVGVAVVPEVKMMTAEEVDIVNKRVTGQMAEKDIQKFVRGEQKLALGFFDK